MKLDPKLDEFNRLLALEVSSVFPDSVDAIQSDDGALRFRGPVSEVDSATHIGTHVTVVLEPDVKVLLQQASTELKARLVSNLLLALGSHIRIRYDPSSVGKFALQISGTVAMAQA